MSYYSLWKDCNRIASDLRCLVIIWRDSFTCKINSCNSTKPWEPKIMKISRVADMSKDCTKIYIERLLPRKPSMKGEGTEIRKERHNNRLDGISTRILCSIIDGRVAIASVRILLRGASLRRVRSIHPSSSGRVLCAFKQISQETFSTSNSVEWPLNLSGSAFMLFTRVEREVRNEDVDEGTK